MVGECDDHQRGDQQCARCWPGYPQPCACGGQVHASFGDENADMDYWLYYACDRCGANYVEA